MALTDTALRTAKPADRPYKLADGRGLYLLVNPTGSRLWRLKYRVGGREKLLAIGAYPDISLAKARERREEARRTLADGQDPSAIKRKAKQATVVAATHSFRSIAEEYLAKREREGLAEVTLKKRRWLIDFALPALGEREIASITAAELLQVIRPIEASGRHETARRMRAAIGAVFRYAIATARAEVDPTFALRDALTAPQVEHRAAVTDASDLGAILRAIDGYHGQPTTKAALRLMPLLFPRPGELRAARWREFDLAKATWAIPAERMKMRHPHRMPLPKQAVAILAELQRLTGGGEYVFPGIGRGDKPISENTLNNALRRLGFGPDVATAHGFRATASTLLNECGLWSADAIERQLAHAEPNAVRRAYARGAHWEERVRLMGWWADHLDALKSGSGQA